MIFVCLVVWIYELYFQSLKAQMLKKLTSDQKNLAIKYGLNIPQNRCETNSKVAELTPFLFRATHWSC